MSRLKAQDGAKGYLLHYFVEAAPYNFLLRYEQMLSILEIHFNFSVFKLFFFFPFAISELTQFTTRLAPHLEYSECSRILNSLRVHLCKQTPL